MVFLRKIVKGAADDSYGIEVAQLAGIPSAVVKRAREVLCELEKGDQPRKPVKTSTEPDTIPFEEYLNKEVIDKLKLCDMDSMTPIEALVFLSELKKMLN